MAAMHSNTTSAGDPIATTHLQEVTGRTVFWALVTLAMNAMAQTSFTGYMLSGDTFEGSLWPHRSSPAVCVMDAIVEVTRMVQVAGDNSVREEVSEAAKPITVAMKLAVFLLGVLPQAIKLFSMRGIPISQILAAIFLSSSIVSMVRTLGTGTTDEDIASTAEHTRDSDSPVSGFNFIYLFLGLFGWIPHIVTLVWAWRFIGAKTQISISEELANLALWLVVLSETLGLLLIFQHATFAILRKRSPLVKVTQYIFWFPSLVSVFRELSRCKNCRTWRSMTVAVGLLSLVSACSFALVYLLHKGTEAWRKKRGTETSCSGASLSHLPTSSHEATRGPSDTVSLHTRDSTGETVVGTSPFTTNHGPPGSDHDSLATTDLAGGQVIQSATDTSSDSSTAATGEVTDAPLPSPDPGEGARDAAPESQQEDKPEFDGVLWKLVRLVFLPLLWAILLYLALKNLQSRHPDLEQNKPTEGQDPFQSNREGESKRQPLWKRFLLYIVLFVFRFQIAIYGLYSPLYDWIWHQARDHSEDITWVAIGIVNLVTAMVYYLVLFDGAGTVSPRWTGILG